MRKIFEIMLSTACNARCSYCYEDAHRISTMSEETQAAAIRFIGNQADYGDETVIVWFGGEPLLFPERIRLLQGEICDLFRRKNVRPTTKLITNGANIMNPKSLSLFASGDIDIVQVSMDGFGSDHVRRKRYASNDVTFDTLLDGITILLEMDLIVSVRVNLGRSNLQSCADLFKFMTERFGERENFKMHPAILYGEWADKASDFLSPDEIESAICQTIGENLSATARKCEALNCFFGYQTYVIDPNGIIYPCEHLIEKRESAIGDLFHLNTILPCTLDRYCNSCTNIAICHQGCIGQEQGDLINEFCWRRAVCDKYLLSQATICLP